MRPTIWMLKTVQKFAVSHGLFGFYSTCLCVASLSTLYYRLHTSYIDQIVVVVNVSNNHPKLDSLLSADHLDFSSFSYLQAYKCVLGQFIFDSLSIGIEMNFIHSTWIFFHAFVYFCIFFHACFLVCLFVCLFGGDVVVWMFFFCILRSQSTFDEFETISSR